MNEITEKDVKRLWVEKDAVCVELKDGRIGRELIRDYEPLRNATRKQLENCRIDCDGVWFDDLDEGLELSGFFSPKKTNPIGRVFWLFPELNASAFARRLGIPQPLFAAYVNGTKKPSLARKKLIDEELRRIGKELLKTVAWRLIASKILAVRDLRTVFMLMFWTTQLGLINYTIWYYTKWYNFFCSFRNQFYGLELLKFYPSVMCERLVL